MVEGGSPSPFDADGQFPCHSDHGDHSPLTKEDSILHYHFENKYFMFNLLSNNIFLLNFNSF